MEQGESVANIARRLVSSGRAIPDDIPDCPPLLPECEYYLTLYLLTDYERKYEGGPIPFSAVRDVSGLTGDALYDAWFVVNYVDTKLTQRLRERREKEAKRAKPKRGK